MLKEYERMCRQQACNGHAEQLSLFLVHAFDSPAHVSPLLAHVHAGADDLIYQQQLRRNHRRALQHLRAASRAMALIEALPEHTGVRI